MLAKVIMVISELKSFLRPILSPFPETAEIGPWYIQYVFKGIFKYLTMIIFFPLFKPPPDTYNSPSLSGHSQQRPPSLIRP